MPTLNEHTKRAASAADSAAASIFMVGFCVLQDAGGGGVRHGAMDGGQWLAGWKNGPLQRPDGGNEGRGNRGGGGEGELDSSTLHSNNIEFGPNILQ